MVVPLVLLAAVGSSQMPVAVPFIIATATASGLAVAHTASRVFRHINIVSVSKGSNENTGAAKVKSEYVENNIVHQTEVDDHGGSRVKADSRGEGPVDNRENHVESRVKADNRNEEPVNNRVKSQVVVESRAEDDNRAENQAVVKSHEQLANEARQRLRLRDGDFNIAVVGQDSKKSGKSSFISAICGLNDGVEDGTPEIKRYKDNHPGRERFVWYDIPDVGNWEGDTSVFDYFRNQGLCLFDLVIVTIGNQRTTAEAEVPSICEQLGLPIFIVRMKANQHVRNLMRSMRYQITYREACNTFVNQNRSFFKPEMKVYCVSADILRGDLKNDAIDEATLFADLQAALREKFEKLRDQSTARLKDRDFVGAAFGHS